MMAIRLDLTEEESGDKEGRDYLDICVLKYGANGVLEISPDFSRTRKPYRVEV